MKTLFSSKLAAVLAVSSLLTAALAVPAQAAVDASACETPEYVQAFLFAGDTNFYTLLPGESPGSFGGEGWQLSGGAQVVETTTANGSASQVLDLPSGSKAVSPVICVTSAYPTARAMVRNVKGSEGIFFYVEYEGTNTWGHPKNTGQIHGSGSAWTAVTPVNMQPYNTPGWQSMRITLVPGGKTSDFQLYDLYVDPRMSR